jgi:ABC-2 type transport system permease protein
MRIILFILRKEFLQIIRNRAMLPIIFVMPVIQLLILANAASFEVKNIKVHIMDFDQSSSSRALISKFKAFRHFDIVNSSFSEDLAYDDFSRDKARLIIKIPKDFEKNMVKQNTAKLQLIINAIDGAAAGVVSVYANAIILDYNKEVVAEWINFKMPDQQATINITYSFWYNPDLNYKTFMVPGILVILVTMIGMFLAGMNIVREKELGTIEQINVTPIKKYQFIAGKLLPFWMIALFDLAFGLLIGKLAFNIPIVGSLWLIFLFAGLYLLVVLGLGLFVSTFTDTQQQAMFISWFIMVIFILMSGLFTPIESMPEWAQIITRFNPVAYFVEVMRMVMLKGAGVSDISRQITVLLIYAIAILSLATWRYRKVS